MILNRFSVLIFIFLAVVACKTQSTFHNSPSGAHSTLIRDSVSVTYKQGTEQPASIRVIEENEPQQSCLCDAMTSCKACSTGKGCASATRNKKGEAIAMAANLRNSEQSERAGDIRIRVDTVFIERWHTEQAERLIGRHQTQPERRDTIPRFYKNCTIGFFLLLLLFFSRFAFRIMKAIYLRR